MSLPKGPEIRSLVLADMRKALESGRISLAQWSGARPTDDVGVVVGLSPKARVTDTSGFFVQN